MFYDLYLKINRLLEEFIEGLILFKKQSFCRHQYEMQTEKILSIKPYRYYKCQKCGRCRNEMP